jgi:hypothetical protein
MAVAIGPVKLVVKTFEKRAAQLEAGLDAELQR